MKQLPLGNWCPSPATVIAGIIVILGFALSAVDWRFLSLAAIGTFGPGMLRELGILRDKDEFERLISYRAAFHAYLITGLLAFLSIGFLRSHETVRIYPEPVISTFLVILWFTWLLSSLIAFWGPQRMAIRILVGFGIVWLLFNILGNLNNMMALIMQSLLAVPFFAMAYAARTWPRIAGIFLLVFAGFFFFFFHLYEVFTGDTFERGRTMVIVLFIGPLMASGLALLRSENHYTERDRSQPENQT